MIHLCTNVWYACQFCQIHNKRNQSNIEFQFYFNSDHITAAPQFRLAHLYFSFYCECIRRIGNAQLSSHRHTIGAFQQPIAFFGAHVQQKK